MDFKDYYKTLGVEKTAGADEIKKAYRKLARQYHPDTAVGDKVKAEERFKEINEAFEVLGDDEKRRKYDELAEQIKNGTYDPKGGFDPSGYSGWAGSPDGRSYTYSWNGNGGDAGGFSDFFNMFFGGMGDMGGFGTRSGGRGRRHASSFAGMDGQDLQGEVSIGVREAIRGASCRVKVGERTIEVKIPAGIGDGETIRVAGQGTKGANGGRDGDLMILIHVEPEAGWSAKGSDLEFEMEVYPWEAAFGCKKTIDAADGRISLNIPAGIQSGRRLRIPGRGLKSKTGRGDLFAKIVIANPRPLSGEAAEHYHALAKLYGGK